MTKLSELSSVNKTNKLLQNRAGVAKESKILLNKVATLSNLYILLNIQKMSKEGPVSTELVKTIVNSLKDCKKNQESNIK